MTPTYKPDPRVVPVMNLEVGDQYWGDSYDHNSNHPLFGDKCIWTVVRAPIASINTGLFDGTSSCVVVAVEYADGSRGSRLWEIKATVRVRRA